MVKNWSKKTFKTEIESSEPTPTVLIDQSFIFLFLSKSSFCPLANPLAFFSTPPLQTRQPLSLSHSPTLPPYYPLPLQWRWPKISISDPTQTRTSRTNSTTRLMSLSLRITGSIHRRRRRKPSALPPSTSSVASPSRYYESIFSLLFSFIDWRFVVWSGVLCAQLMVLVDGAGGEWPVIGHAPWDGCNLADFVMPFFLFIVGMAIPLSLKVDGSLGT